MFSPLFVIYIGTGSIDFSYIRQWFTVWDLLKWHFWCEKIIDKLWIWHGSITKAVDPVFFFICRHWQINFFVGYNESRFLNIVVWNYLILSLLFSFGLLSWNPTTLNTSFNNKNLAKKLKTSFLLPTITQGDWTHILFKTSNH